MGQLYYPPKRDIIDYATLGLNLYDIKKRHELHKGYQDVQRQRHELEERQHEALYGKDVHVPPGSELDIGGGEIVENMPGGGIGTLVHRPGLKEQEIALDRGRLGVQRGQLGVLEKQAETAAGRLDLDERIFQESIRQFNLTEKQIEAAYKPSNPGELMALRASLVNMDDHFGFEFSNKKVGQTVVDAMESLTKQGHIRITAYDSIIANWPRISKPLTEAANKELEMENQKAFPDKERIAKLTNAIKEMSDPSLADRIYFPSCSKIREYERTMMEIEKAKAEKEPRALKAYITPQNTVEYLPNNQPPPTGWVPYQTGIEFETTPEGEASLRTGVLPSKVSTGGMQKGTTRTLEEKVIDATEGVARLEQISQSFSPEFLQLGTKWQAFTTKWKEKLKGTPVEKWADLGVSDKDKQGLEKFTAFRRDAIDNINRYIKEITGAQMSEREADRLRKAAPDPGEGFFDGDSPTEFQSKWKSAMKALKLSQARYIYLLQSGINEQIISNMAKKDTLPNLGRIERIIRKRDKEIEAEIREANPNISEVEIDRLVSQQLKEEFGI